MSSALVETRLYQHLASFHKAVTSMVFAGLAAIPLLRGRAPSFSHSSKYSSFGRSSRIFLPPRSWPVRAQNTANLG